MKPLGHTLPATILAATLAAITNAAPAQAGEWRIYDRIAIASATSMEGCGDGIEMMLSCTGPARLMLIAHGCEVDYRRPVLFETGAGARPVSAEHKVDHKTVMLGETAGIRELLRGAYRDGPEFSIRFMQLYAGPARASFPAADLWAIITTLDPICDW